MLHMESGLVSRVTIFAVGVEKYDHIPPLYGPSSDIENIHNLLVKNPSTALFGEDQFISIQDPTSNDLRTQISSYTLSRSADADILVFYFSGHGVSIGRDDFGFCTTDTDIHPGANKVLPLTVVKFSDLLDTVSLMGIIPIVIIDACYSGIAGNALIQPHDAIVTMQNEIRRTAASNYALLCSCSDLQSSVDTPKGGVFSRCLFDVISNGIQGLNSNLVSLKDVFQPLNRLIETEIRDAKPRLFLGDTLLDFPLARNILFTPQSYSFVGHLLCIIKSLWNNGNERELTPSEIHDICGKGAYGNHQKLSLEPWMLVENVPNSRNRRLTQRGRLFAQGKLKIPKTIEKDPSSNKWVVAAGSIQVDINSV